MTATETKTSPKTATLRPWKLILENDNAITYDHVLESVHRIMPELSAQDIDAKVMEAHSEGRSILIVTHFERAEFLKDQFASCLPPIPTKIEAD